MVDRKDMITGENIQAGDTLVGIASSGIHSNGFSLIRKVFDMTEESLNTYYDELGAKLGDVLLTPTRIYVKALKALRTAGVDIKGASHITGGGFYENVPRMLPDGTRASIRLDAFQRLPIFDLIQKKGNIADEMMYNTYNCGLGMVLAVDASDAERAVSILNEAGEKAYIVGSVISGEKGVDLC